MDRNFLIKLTNNLYQLTLLFPKKEPLRYKMRELADEILNDFYKDQNPEIFKNLETLDSFFEVVKNQSWVSQDDILFLQKEYNKLKEDLENSQQPNQVLEKVKIFDKLKAAELKTENVSQFSNSRHGKILGILKEKGRAQVWEIKQIFPEVSKRTLRRDFEQMVNQGIIERMGERNNTFYQIPSERGERRESNSLRTETG
jgi:Fic family protein